MYRITIDVDVDLNKLPEPDMTMPAGRQVLAGIISTLYAAPYLRGVLDAHAEERNIERLEYSSDELEAARAHNTQLRERLATQNREAAATIDALQHELAENRHEWHAEVADVIQTERAKAKKQLEEARRLLTAATELLKAKDELLDKLIGEH